MRDNSQRTLSGVMVWAICSWALLVAPAAADDKAVKQGDGEGVPADKFAQAPPDTLTPEVEAILDALENAGKELKTIHCDVVYHEQDQLNVTETTKIGSIRFERAEPHPKFLIHFEKTFADDIVLKNQEWWLFVDRWLWEAKSKTKIIIKREVVAQGEEVDFFNLERSPIPMPFGQTKAQVHDNFHVKLVPPAEGDPPNTDHLLCIPRAGKQLSREYLRLEYLVSKEIHLPVRIIAEDERGEKVQTADFCDPGSKGTLTGKSINMAFGPDTFMLPPETRGYHVSEEPLESQNGQQ